MDAPDVCPALPEDVEAWLGWLASQRRAAPLTLQAYRRDLARLAGWTLLSPLGYLAGSMLSTATSGP